MDRGWPVNGHPFSFTKMRIGLRLPNSLLVLLVLTVASCSDDSDSAPDNMRSAPVETISIAGTLADSWCYSKLSPADRSTFPLVVDEACSEQSMEQGYPLLVVVNATETWLLSENPRILRDALNDSVRVTGDIRSEGVLIPRTVVGKIGGVWSTIIDPQSTYQVSGTVTGTTPDRDMIIVRHDEIDGYMGAMTMPFMVRDSSLISGVSKGDSIRFSIMVSDGDAVMNAIHFVGIDAPQ
jgi:Cu/Ag efflux protein CusF